MTGEEPERGWGPSGPEWYGSFLGAHGGHGGDGVVALGVVNGIALSLPLWAMIIAAGVAVLS